MAGRGFQIQIGATVAQLSKDMDAVVREVSDAGKDAERAWVQNTNKMGAGIDELARKTREAMGGLRNSTASGGASASGGRLPVQGLPGGAGLPPVDPKNAAELIRQAAAVDALRASMDPLYRATLQYEAAVEQVNAAVQSGAIDQKRANAVLEIAEAQFKQAAAAARGLDAAEEAVGGLGSRMNALKPAIQNASYQIQDFAVQVAAGGSATTALTQQLPQLLGSFGLFGAVAGAAAAVLLPLAANILMTGEEAETAEDRIDRLRDAVNAYVDSAEAARTPTKDLEERFQGMAETARDALQAQEDLDRNKALRTLAADADALAASLDVVAGLVPRALGAFGNAGSVRSGQANAVSAYDEAIEDLADKLGISKEAAEAFYAAIQRIMQAEGPEAIVEAAQAAREELIAAAGGADNLNEAAGEAAENLNAMVLAGGELDGAMSPVVQKAEEFSTWLRDAHEWAQRVKEEMQAAAGVTLDNHFDRNQAIPFAQYNSPRISEAADQGILALIRSVEGTAGPNGYNTSLGNGRFLPGGVEQDLTNKTLAEIRDLQRAMLANPDNTFNSSAIGAYQIVGTTLDGLIDKLDLSLSERFTPELQDRLGLELVRQREGQGLAGFQSEWEGIRDQGVTEAQLTRALGTQVVPAQDPQVAREAEQAATEAEREREQAAKKAADEAQRQLDIRGDLIAQSQQMTSDAQFEATLVGQSAQAQAALRAEYLLTNQAKAQGISLTETVAGSEETYGQMIQRTAAAIGAATVAEQQRTAAMEASAERQAQLEGVASTVASSLTDGLMAAVTGAESFGDAMRGAISSILADLARLIIQQTIYNALARAMGVPQGPSLLGGLGLPGGAEGGAFAVGGYTGHGAKHDVAGIVHRGEYVLPASSVRRIGIPALEMMRRGAIVRPGFAEGGWAGMAGWGGRSGGSSSQTVSVNPTPVENYVLLGDAEIGRLLSSPSAQRNIIRFVEREGFTRG